MSCIQRELKGTVKKFKWLKNKVIENEKKIAKKYTSAYTCEVNRLENNNNNHFL